METIRESSLILPNGMRDVAPPMVELTIDSYMTSGPMVAVDDELGGAAFKQSGIVPDPTQIAILKHAGWLDDVTAPDTVRLFNAARKRGLTIGLVAQTKNDLVTEMAGEMYGALVDKRIHPVGVANLINYMHDISEDHYPAIFAAGRALFELVRPAGNPNLIEIARAYDICTQLISSLLIKRCTNPKDKLLDNPLHFFNLPYSVLNIGAKESKRRSTEIARLVYVGMEEMEMV